MSADINSLCVGFVRRCWMHYAFVSSVCLSMRRPVMISFVRYALIFSQTLVSSALLGNMKVEGHLGCKMLFANNSLKQPF